ncbi:glutamate--cysteine ligase [Actinomadura namibiensis]|uniref:Putative glutamate--cysteine ligase 2 n=1 Tax=Actinomadura namibiensis TaxID=182080 RepID=A0A7W3QPQ9_ACTNM|nr:glutamate--cysteine ligase [Actinomadura namibiensis]MBA8954925.1 carboxylate-amine ligase [Actinomadura namibiensis]
MTNALTIGVEEEFLLVEAGTGRSAPGAARVLARARERPLAPGAALHAELLATQVEAATGVCSGLAELRDQLEGARAALGDAARAEGLWAVSTGTPVLPNAAPPFTPGERPARIGDLYAGVVAGYEVSGCHVHVGVADREAAVAVLGHLRPWLPTLLALSANSPFDRGRDSGYASWRMMEQAHFPGSGVPPSFASAADYDRAVERLVDCGVIADAAMTFWLARLSPHLPTVEVRAADAVVTADEAVLQAALTRGLVRAALDDLAAGREGPRVDDQVCAAAVWTAARYGIAGPAVDPVAERRVPAGAMLAALLDRVRPALDAAGDLAAVERLLARVSAEGSGADRQRRAAALGPHAVAEWLARQACTRTYRVPHAHQRIQEWE